MKTSSSERSELWVLRSIVIAVSAAFLSHRFDWFSSAGNPWYLDLLAFCGLVSYVLALAIMDETRAIREGKSLEKRRSNEPF
jgi:hypothetical protein